MSVYVCLPLLFSAGRNVGPRGPPGPGPAPNYNRSTEDLRMKQQPAPNYGRLRESNCDSLVSLFACFLSSFLHQADFSTPVLHPPRQPFPPSRVIFPSPVFLRLSPAASHPPRSDQSFNHHESCSDNKVHLLTLFGFIHPSATDSFKCNKQTNTGRII